MKIQILKKKTFEHKTWFLCSGNLYDYISSIKKDFSSFSVQRRIVRNKYLEGLYKTIESGEPIPSVTLTCSEQLDMHQEGTELDMSKVDILDGLQRTFRLWVAYELDVIINNKYISEYRELRSIVDSEYPDMIDIDFITPSYLKTLLEKDANGERYSSRLMKSYKNYEIIFVIWTGLNDDEIIKKMLFLNAGQRPMSSIHQYELLFLRYFEHSDKNIIPEIKLYREKDERYSLVKKGIRHVGEWTFTSVVIALQSFIERKPLRVVPSNMIVWNEESLLDPETVAHYFQKEELDTFMQGLLTIDKAFHEAGNGTWFGKDTSMSGIFAALGRFKYEKQNDARLDGLLNNVASKVACGELDFDQAGFEKAYNELSSVRINVGDVLRKAICDYTYRLMSEGKANWNDSFSNTVNR